MSKPARYDLASAVVYDSVASNRNSTRNALYSLGFRDSETVATLDDLKTFLEEREPDLVVCEAVGDEDVCGFAQAVRRGEIGRNPFVVIVVTAWVSSGDLVKRVVGSGVDDLLVRPFSIKQLGDRIRIHVEARKGFVVTSDYIGPDRRRDPERPDGAELIHVPNSLKLKAGDGKTQAEVAAVLQQQVQQSRAVINLEKMRRDAFQIGILANFLKEAADLAESPMLRQADIERVVAINAELTQRAKQFGYGELDDLCRTVGTIASTIASGTAVEKNALVLGQLATAMQMVLTPELDVSAHQSELRSTLAKIRERGRNS